MSHLKGRKAAIIFDAFKSIFIFYIQRSFRIQTVHADGEFRVLKDLIQKMPAGTRVNLTSGNKHVPEIERHICVVKEISHAFHHSLPFNRIPKLITIHVILNITKMLNYFLTKQGISLELSPRSILIGESLKYKKHLTIQPVQYCQVHENKGPRKSDKARTQGAICLGPFGNLQGGFKFMSLQNVQKITR